MTNLTTTHVLLALAAGALATGLLVLTRFKPGAGLVLWLLVIAFVPIWVEARVVVPISAASAVGFVVLVSLLGRQSVVFGPADLLFAFLVACATAPMLVGHLSLSAFVGVATVWVVGFGLGRLAGTVIDDSWVYGAVAVVFTLVAALAIVEFVTGWHGLASWGPSNSSSATWRPIQVRSGLARAEGAFGHSIALGSSLAIALVMTVACRFRPAVRFAMITVMLVGVATTLSRGALISAASGLLLCVIFLRVDSVRLVRKRLLLMIVVAGAVLVPAFARLLAESAEAGPSAEYRGSLVSLLPFVRIFGRSDALQISPTGRAYFGGFRSIDSQLVLFGLSYGALTLGLVVTLLVLAVVRVIGLRARPATVALIAQIPSLLTVALITQYHLFFWFTAGLAAASEVRAASQRVCQKPILGTPLVRLQEGRAP